MGLLNQLVVRSLPFVPKPIVRRFSSRYIAGAALSEGISVVRGLNDSGYLATMDILGEHITRKDQAAAATAGYIALLEEIHARGVRSNISIKLTMLGLKLSRDLCASNLASIAAAAARLENFVRIDMEDASCTDDTLAIYAALRPEHSNLGVVIQACLRRSRADVLRLGKLRANVRVVKGIYVEPRRIAFRDRAVVRRNFALLLDDLFRAGCYVGIATHDEELVWEGLRLVARHGLSPDQYEFQMLLGVDEELRAILRDAGHRLRVYVPFGTEWFAYSTRRLKENPEIAGHIIRNLLRPR